jgi:hypothetical protein
MLDTTSHHPTNQRDSSLENMLSQWLDSLFSRLECLIPPLKGSVTNEIPVFPSRSLDGPLVIPVG